MRRTAVLALLAAGLGLTATPAAAAPPSAAAPPAAAAGLRATVTTTCYLPSTPCRLTFRHVVAGPTRATVTAYDYTPLISGVRPVLVWVVDTAGSRVCVGYGLVSCALPRAGTYTAVSGVSSLGGRTTLTATV